MLRRIVSPFKEFGPLAGLLYAIDRLLSALSPGLRLFAYDLMVQPIAGAPLLERRSGSSLLVRQIQAGDAELAQMPVPPAVIQARQEQDATCLGVFKQGTMIGYMWFCERRYREDEVRCDYLLEPAAQSVFDYDFYILPQHRMGRGFAALWDGANQHLGARGMRFTFSRVSRFNTASRRAHQHLGAVRVGRVAFLRLWSAQLMAATVHPYAHLSITERARVQVTLRPDALQEHASD